MLSAIFPGSLSCDMAEKEGCEPRKYGHLQQEPWGGGAACLQGQVKHHPAGTPELHHHLLEYDPGG